MSLLKVLDIAEGLLTLDPVRTYPQRAAELVAKLARANWFRLELDGAADGGATQAVASEPSPPNDGRTVSLPIRNGRQTFGVLHLHPQEPGVRFGADELRLARWGTRVLARGLGYAHRLASEGGRRSGERVAETLGRAPLTPRERDVAALVISGVSTRDIASRTGLTVSTVNTYLKRIFAKLGVHSRVELVARMAGTDGLADEAAAERQEAMETEGRPSHIRRRLDLPAGDVAATRPADEGQDGSEPSFGQGAK
ncbi:MAG: helix-turn-helix transcriptional regulator [Myxococcota bacterium]